MSLSLPLQHKTAVITGASSGIGRAMVERFVAAGARVIACGRNPEGLAAVAGLEGVLTVETDVTHAPDIERLAEQVRAHFGKVDIVVPNAGIARVIPFEQCTREAMAEQFDANFFGAVETVRVLLPHINSGGAVLFVTTFLTQVGFPGLAAYNASKAALKSFAQTLAAELAPRGIRVNSVAPGPIATPLWGTVGLPEAALKGVAAQITTRLMPQRFGEPGDIADTAVFLASDQARFIYGQEIVVDGGYTIG
ncbi:SDR family NAD(P)-dependent oxidoreductase [Azohydromonas aeria]|uniref:SDR family NAD(P)-dependent oxidoreductase n=1 Tax=Azohydromonas aeria TaxID=2590212 RepID=UPI0012FC1A44|nr:SDR family oxidoreductase [Azohydromonas aeria]